MLKANNIYKSYGKLDVLKGVSVSFPDNKITSLLGANATGKSTLLGVIARLLQPNSGEVFLDGENVQNMKSKEVAKKLSILKQTNNIGIRISVRDLVSFGRFPHSNGRLTVKDKEMIDTAIEYMAVEDIQHKYLDQLSGGQRQRAYIAMIIAQDTKYVLLDEPLNNLDMKYAVEMMFTFRRLVEDFNKTIIVVMHDINFAAAYSDHIIAMKGGHIIASGDVNEVITKPIMDNVYDHDFTISEVDGQKVCIYYRGRENYAEGERVGKLIGRNRDSPKEAVR